MKFKNITIMAIALGVVATSCKKEEVVPQPNPAVEPSTSVDQRFNDFLESKEQIFSVDANTAMSIFGNEGTEIQLSGNNFTDASGNALTGNVDITLVEIYKKSDMVLTNKTTLGEQGGALSQLISGGEFYIEVKQAGVPVTIPNPMQINTQVMVTPDFNMNLFDGNVAANGDITWSESIDSVTVVADSSQFDWNYSFPFGDSIGWINCDYFWNNPAPQTGVTVNTPSQCDDTNTNVYVVFQNDNTAANLYHQTGNEFGTGSYYTLPEGMSVYFVVVTDDGGQLQYAVQAATIGTNHVENVTSLTNVADMAALEVILDTYF